MFDVLLPNLKGSGTKVQGTRLSRYISPTALNNLRLKLPNTVNHVFSQACSVDSLTENFNGALQGLLDSVAPAKIRKGPQKCHTPWLTADLLALRKSRRKAERQWHSSSLEVHFQLWHENLTTYQSSMAAAKAAYTLI